MKADRFRVFWTAIVLAVVLVGCQKDSLLEPVGDEVCFVASTAHKAIVEVDTKKPESSERTVIYDDGVFRVYEQVEDMVDYDTKGTVTTTVPDSFNVSCYSHSVTDEWAAKTPNVCYNRTFTKSGSTWVGNGSPVYYSSSDKLSSFAWYGGGTLTTTSSTIGAPVLSFTVSDAIGSQEDLMVASKLNSTSGSNALAFTHALCAVTVHFTPPAGGNHSGTRIADVYNSGNYYFATGLWSDQTGSGSYLSEHNISLVASNASAAGTIVTEFDGSDTLLLIPQTCPSGSKLYISMQFPTNTGVERNFGVSLSGKVWEPGKHYTYSVEVSCGYTVVLTRGADLGGYKDHSASWLAGSPLMDWYQCWDFPYQTSGTEFFRIRSEGVTLNYVDGGPSFALCQYDSSWGSLGSETFFYGNYDTRAVVWNPSCRYVGFVMYHYGRQSNFNFEVDRVTF